MDVSTLTLNPEAIHEAIHYEKSQEILVAKKDIKLYVPEHYFNGKLGTIDSRYNVVGLVGWVVDGFYAKSLVNATIPFTPEEISIVKIDDGTYYEMSWTAGAVICPNNRLPVKKTLVFEIYDEIVAKGKQPWYVKHRDRAEIFYSAPVHADVNLGGGQSLQSIFCASCMRDPKDRNRPARETFEVQADYDEAEIDIIPLRSVAYGADNTASRFLGSYLRPAMNSSLVNPSETTEDIESILRT